MQLPLAAIGLVLCGCIFAPLLLYFGHYLFKRGLEKQKIVDQLTAAGTAPDVSRQAAAAQLPPVNKGWVVLAGALGFLILSLGLLIVALGFDELLAFSGL